MNDIAFDGNLIIKMLINLVSMHVSSSCKRNFGNVINGRNIARFQVFLLFFLFFFKLFNSSKVSADERINLIPVLLLIKIFLINIKSILIIHIGLDIFLFEKDYSIYM